ncbi:hypothetical protein BRD15_10880 [Halobacteriales archaeon SW_6_65_15]|jgi:hypothetical protein|nr:MAG: hypothetical protein BRD15_10880 [Halobacteriales archaeon SW_6_65_15]
MNGRTFGILLGLVILGIAFAGGATAAEDLSDDPEQVKCPPEYSECSLDDVISGADAPITADGPITADAPITAGSPITSMEETPLSGCCCCEWRYNPALDVMSELRAY